MVTVQVLIGVWEDAVKSKLTGEVAEIRLLGETRVTVTA